MEIGLVNVGDEFNEEFVLSEETHEGFMKVFKDRHPLHTSTKYANKYGFSSNVMHGNILNGYLSYFVGECFPLKQIMILAQDIKFSNPVYLGDKLLLVARVAAIHQSVSVVELSCRFTNSKAVTVAKAALSLRALTEMDVKEL